MKKGKIYPSYKRVYSSRGLATDIMVFGALKKEKGKTKMKNFRTRKEAENWLGW